MSLSVVTIGDVQKARPILAEHVSAAPLIRSYSLEKKLALTANRRAWLKDYGWTPVGSFKLLGAINWMAGNLDRIGDRPVAAHSSGNFAAGIAFAGMRYNKRVIIVMPQTAPRVKFELTRSFGAEIRTYDISRDHETGERDRLTREITDQEGAVQASPYDDPLVIAGNGVGGLEVVEDLERQGRDASRRLFLHQRPEADAEADHRSLHRTLVDRNHVPRSTGLSGTRNHLWLDPEDGAPRGAGPVRLVHAGGAAVFATAHTGAWHQRRLVGQEERDLFRRDQRRTPLVVARMGF